MGELTFIHSKAKSLAKNSIDMHCHGIGPFDFTDIKNINLIQIEKILTERQYKSILTLYLTEYNLDRFITLMKEFHHYQKTKKIKYIQGLALEGPLLASHGGTPHIGVWSPSISQWNKIAQLGRLGLKYVILSPDANLQHTSKPYDSKSPQKVSWIIEKLLSYDVLPAPGHFRKDNPKKSAHNLQILFDLVAAWGKGPTITDHLINDMPHNFKHAWRTEHDRKERHKELDALKIDQWQRHNMEECLGLVPATMIRNAHRGLVKIAQNFDGEHVDLEIIKQLLKLVGAENMVMMTDSIESKYLAGRKLSTIDGSTLLYQKDGLVAAGSQNVVQQITNMLKLNFTKNDIDLITKITPKKLLYSYEKTTLSSAVNL